WGGHPGVGHFGGHHRRFGFAPGLALGLGLGYGWGWGWGWGPPYWGWGGPYYGYGYYGYGYPPVAAMPSAPPVYIQRQDIEPSAPQPNYWYYCRNPEGYYPYVKECAEGWVQVAPQPSGQQ
ncbi:MAG: hypothetical protein KGM95_02735, partial [Betaproteobacteria bacterium]|nr:hypothetical protein [Betaproteobacteria bacterium]